MDINTAPTRKTARTSIGVRKVTKDRLDGQRAPGQCYNGFICQLLDLWEKTSEESTSYTAGSAGGNQGVEGPASTYRLK